MIPRVVAALDSAWRRVIGQPYYEPDWSRWPVPTCPPVPRWEGPWHEDLSGRPVDRELTGRLVDFDVSIGVGAGRPPWDGATGGMPITEHDSKGRKTLMWDLSKAIGGWWWAPLFPVTGVALPERVRREGDPVGAFDRHVYLHDSKRRTLTEMICVDTVPALADALDGLKGVAAAVWRLRTFGQADWTVGYPGGGPGIVSFDLSKPYDPKRSPHGIVAAGVPQAPMFAGWEEIVAGVIDHCLFLALDNYRAGKPVGWARGTDGELLTHPLPAGSMLRLTERAYARIVARGNHAATVIATALHTHGAFLGDKTGGKGGGIPVTQDRRWHEGDGTLPGLAGLEDLRLTDFEVVQPTN